MSFYWKNLLWDFPVNHKQIRQFIWVIPKPINIFQGKIKTLNEYHTNGVVK